MTDAQRCKRVAIAAVLLGPLMGSAMLVRAQDADPEAPPRESIDGGESSKGPPTAEDMLRELRRARPLNDVVAPSSGTWSGEGPEYRKLWPEGWAVVDRSGYLNRDGDWWLFAFEPDEGDPPLRLLPNANLEVLVRTATHATMPVRFVISGSSTVYEDQNYLLVKSVTRDRQTPDKTTRSVRDDRSPTPVSVTGSSDDVMKALRDAQPDTDVIDPRERFSAAEAASATRTLRPDGMSIINRPARVVRQGRSHRLVFESDHPDRPEPPLTMLPNQNMMRMVHQAATDNLGLVFIVSGEITQFQGENYLLVQSATQRMSTGNFRK